MEKVSNKSVVNSFRLTATNITILPHLSKRIYNPERIELQNKSKKQKILYTLAIYK